MKSRLCGRIFILAAGFLSLVAGCGGSGSDGGGGGGGGGGGSTGGGGGSSGSATLIVGNSSVSTTVDPASTVPHLPVQLSVENSPANFFYGVEWQGSAAQDVNVSWDPVTTNGALQGSADIVLYSPGLMGSGTYTDAVTIRACMDSQCRTPLAGSPRTVTVTYVVTGNGVSNATYYVLPASLNVEVPSSGAAPVETLNIAAYELPPYGAYVRYESQSGGAVSSMDFQATSASVDYGTGILTINLRDPGVVGPGVYSDVVTLSICYDSGCTRQAIGSPWKIPVSYAITAAAGREFQQRIIDVHPAALAADPTGQVLFAAVGPDATDTPHLLRIDPVSGTVQASVALDASIARMTVSRDGQFLYLATASYTPPSNVAAQVERMRVSDLAVDLVVPLSARTGEISALDVSPLDAHTFAVGYSYNDPFAPRSWIASVFDDGVARQGTRSDNSDILYSNGVQWSSDGATLFVRDSDLAALPVSGSGLGTGATLLALSNGDGFYGTPLHQVGGVLYGDGGGVLDPGTGTVLGRYEFRTPRGQGAAPGASVLADLSTNRTFATYIDSTSEAAERTVQSFDRTSFNTLSFARLPVTGDPVRWGRDGLALMGQDPNAPGLNVLYLINGTFVAPAP